MAPAHCRGHGHGRAEPCDHDVDCDGDDVTMTVTVTVKTGTMILYLLVVLCSPSLCHISITTSSSYLLFLYTCIHHCLYHTFPFLELFLVTALTF
jgi:hypothetical protein